MENVRLLCLLVSLASILFLLIGLIRPWMMLWWEDVQNRRKVIKVYATVAIIFYLIYICLGFMPVA
ncbi:MAG: hypothetical protein HY015_10610 [Bacteroidetes bacterium]|nr:hypothetical protein [Bacteroidota bacterium]MBI3483400.1 hypothetical protein [Bacteroidota bacterium]